MNLFHYENDRRVRMSRRVLRGFSPERFANVRSASGLSASDLARLADITPTTILNWEAGKGTPQVDLLARTMRILETPIDQVITIAAAERFPGDWRVIRGMTQPELAASARIATTTLRGIERADSGLTEANAVKLAVALDISVDEYRAAYQRARQRPAGTTA